MIISDLKGAEALIVGEDYNFSLRFPVEITSLTVEAVIRKKTDKTTIISFTVTKDISNNKRATFSLTDVQTATLSSYAGTSQFYRVRTTSGAVPTTVITGELEIRT